LLMKFRQSLISVGFLVDEVGFLHLYYIQFIP
jgi:hypothetical protein